MCVLIKNALVRLPVIFSLSKASTKSGVWVFEWGSSFSLVHTMWMMQMSWNSLQFRKPQGTRQGAGDRCDPPLSLWRWIWWTTRRLNEHHCTSLWCYCYHYRGRGEKRPRREFSTAQKMRMTSGNILAYSDDPVPISRFGGPLWWKCKNWFSRLDKCITESRLSIQHRERER